MRIVRVFSSDSAWVDLICYTALPYMAHNGSASFSPTTCVAIVFELIRLTALFVLSYLNGRRTQNMQLSKTQNSGRLEKQEEPRLGDRRRHCRKPLASANTDLHFPRCFQARLQLGNKRHDEQRISFARCMHHWGQQQLQHESDPRRCKGLSELYTNRRICIGTNII